MLEIIMWTVGGLIAVAALGIAALFLFISDEEPSDRWPKPFR